MSSHLFLGYYYNISALFHQGCCSQLDTAKKPCTLCTDSESSGGLVGAQKLVFAMGHPSRLIQQCAYVMFVLYAACLQMDTYFKEYDSTRVSDSR